ncbi:hypothetical protein H0H93_010446 [Arthromyces matolae]|nr:hypothetical protein H0H93_010446 [Arthromyces matolae]
MHLIWENNIDNLLSHWTGSFKGLDDGMESYQFPKTVWDAIGAATATAGATIPSAYGARVPNIATHRSTYSAEMKSIWTMYIGPVLLQHHFTHAKYFNHFVSFVRIINRCIQFEMTYEDIEDVRGELIQWVQKYEEIYYQQDLQRLPTCPITVHALLHLASSIKFAGPVWCYWAYPMERYCGQLQPTIKSRRFPYASIDRYVTEDAQLSQIKITHNLFAELSLKAPRIGIRGSCQVPEYPSCILLPPKSHERPTEHLQSITAAIATRFKVTISIARKAIAASSIEEWGKVRRVDSSEGDTFRAAGLGIIRDDSRDASFVRYEVLIDKNAHRRRQQSQFEVQTFYGQLQHIYLVRIPDDCRRSLKIKSDTDTTLILAGIRSCKLDNAPSPALASLDVHFYTSLGTYDVIDITTVQSLVGRFKAVPTARQWALVDRSGSLARAVYDGDDDEDED